MMLFLDRSPLLCPPLLGIDHRYNSPKSCAVTGMCSRRAQDDVAHVARELRELNVWLEAVLFPILMLVTCTCTENSTNTLLLWSGFYFPCHLPSVLKLD